MPAGNIRIAIQSSGRLKEASLSFLKSLGLEIDAEDNRNLVVPCKNAPIEIIYVRHRDIPQFVENGVVDFGIVGKNVLFELQSAVKQLSELDFARCSLVVAVPNNSNIKTFLDLEGERVATSYPNSLKKFLKSKLINAAVIELRGSIEAAIALGLADAVCDITQTGKTLRENGLAVIGEVFSSQAVLIKSPFVKLEDNLLFKNYYEKILS